MRGYNPYKKGKKNIENKENRILKKDIMFRPIDPEIRARNHQIIRDNMAKKLKEDPEYYARKLEEMDKRGLKRRPRYANQAGAPRTSSFTPGELIALGEEMVSWIKSNIDTVTHLSDWYTLEKYFTYKEWKAIKICREFVPYYERALKMVSKQILHRDSLIEPTLKHRWMRVYFQDLKEEEDETKVFEHSLKIKEAEKVNEEDRKNHTLLMDQLASLRETFKQSKTKESDETKS